MVFQPGHSGNPHGYSGPRRRRYQEIYDEINKRGHQSSLLTLSEIQNDPNQEPAVRVTAAGMLAPFLHPKMQALPTPRYIEHPFEVPEFSTISDASTFLAKIPVLVARGELDIDFGK